MQKVLKEKIYLFIENVIVVPIMIVGILNNIFYPLKLNMIILLILIYELLLIFYNFFFSKYVKIKANTKVKMFFLSALLALSVIFKGIAKG